MVTEFVRFDTKRPVAKYGVDFYDYVVKNLRDNYNKKRAGNEEYFDYTLLQYYNYQKHVWKNHKPPVGVKGLYAFINRPENITYHVIPGDVSEVMWSEAKSMVMSDNYTLAENIILRNNGRLKCAYHYRSSDCKRIFVHTAVLSDDGLSMQYDGVKWECYDPKDFTPTKDMYEVFLELK